MTRIVTIIFLLCWVLNSFSQEFSTHWIAYPTPDDSSEVLFCHTYVSTKRPQQAQISFASCGQVKVYVNERNITRDICFNNTDSNNILIETVNITQLLRPDSNTIAVWYAPVTGTSLSKQLSLEYYGKDYQGRDFYHQADGSWSCTLLKGSYKAGKHEVFDNSNYDSNWKSCDYNRFSWLNPLGAYQGTKTCAIALAPFDKKRVYLYHILKPIDSYVDSEGIHYDFGREFKGTIRATIRDAHKGECLRIDNFTYICNGELDEQAYRRFTSSKNRIITIKGDFYFKESQLVNIEGLEYE